MKQHAKEFLQQVVEPTCAEYLATAGDLRRARLAAIVLEHMTDYWVVEKSLKLNAVREMVLHECAEAKIIRDVADASKHCSLDRRDALTKRAEQVVRHPGSVLGGFPLNSGPLNAAPAILVVQEFDDGSRQFGFNPVMSAVLSYWQRKCASA
jgi:hypothetical protein